jgi:hypothetical protein
VFNPERERDAVVVELASQSQLNHDAAELRDVLLPGVVGLASQSRLSSDAAELRGRETRKAGLGSPFVKPSDQSEESRAGWCS